MENIQDHQKGNQQTIDIVKELYSNIQNTVRCTYRCTLLELFICFNIIGVRNITQNNNKYQDTTARCV